MKIIKESLKSRIIKIYRRLCFSEKTGFMLNLLTLHISDEKVSLDYEEYQVSKVIKGAYADADRHLSVYIVTLLRVCD